MENEVVCAVRNLCRSMRLGGVVNADMTGLVDVTSRLPLATFDYWERIIRSEYSAAIPEHEAPKWKVWAKRDEVLTWLDVISWNGYKRERALRTLSGAVANAFLFSLVLRRLNDWVPQVREAACQKILELSKETNSDHVAEALCIVFSNWNSWGRIDGKGRAIVLKVACEVRVAESLFDKMISSATGPMTFVFSQLGRTSVLDQGFERIARFAVQPSLRAKAYRSLYEGKITWAEGREWVWTDIRYCQGKLKPILGERILKCNLSKRDLLKRSAVDKSSIVRRVAAEFLIRDLNCLGGDTKQMAYRFSMDPSRAVAERGDFALRKIDVDDNS